MVRPEQGGWFFLMLGLGHLTIGMELILSHSWNFCMKFPSLSSIVVFAGFAVDILHYATKILTKVSCLRMIGVFLFG